MKLRSLLLHLVTVGALFSAYNPTNAQLIINQSQTPSDMVLSALPGQGVFARNVFFNGQPGIQPAITDSIWGEIGRFNGSNTCLGLRSGIFLCTNKAETHLPGPNNVLMVSGGGRNASITPDMDLARLTGRPGWQLNGGAFIHGSSILEFDFVPVNDMISFRYVFSSEEYERWACSAYNDVFGWFISGPGISGPFSNSAMNIAFVPGSMAPVCINAVNSGRLDVSNANGPSFSDVFAPCFAADSNWQANAQYYRYNGGQWTYPGTDRGPQLEAPYNEDPYYIQHNGMTVVLTASAAVQVGQTYHMKMGVSNVSDNSYPSAVFIEGGSFKSSDRFTLSVDDGPNVQTSTGNDPILFESETDSIFLRFNRWGGFYLDEHLRIAVEGSAVEGVDYLPNLPDSIHFSQLDSAAVVPISLPVRSTEMRELTVHLITSNGDKVMTYHLIIAPEFMTGAERLEPVQREQLVVFPNPAQNILHVTLPPDMKGHTEMQVLDMAGRVVARQVLNGAASTTIDMTALPDGLYILKTVHQGKTNTARVSVQRR